MCTCRHVHTCRSPPPATVHALDLASSCSDTVSKKDRKSFGWGLFARTFCLTESQMNTHLYPDIRRSFPTLHFSIFRQEQNVTVIRKLSKAGLEEPRRAKECAWISNTVAADFFSFQRLSLDSRVWTMIEWVAFAALIHLQMNDSREVSAFIHTASHGPEAKGYHGKSVTKSNAW